MWYLAAITLASKDAAPDGAFHCEECNVLFESDSARGAYEKAIDWAAENASGSRALLGITHLTTVGDTIGEGVDICGRVFKARDVWNRKLEFRPAFEELGAAFSEASRDDPIGEALGEERANELREHLENIWPDGGDDVG